MDQEVVNQDVMDGNLNAARPVKDDGAIEQKFETSVPIMALTAVKERQKNIKEIVFYALVDTGADVSICTKDLAEKMFRWSPEDSIIISFLNEKAKKYQCMKKTLQLKYGESDTVSIPDVAFIDIKLPYSQCVPDKWLAKEHGYSGDYCHAVHEKRSVDMILGAKDWRKFQVLEKCRWNNAAACEYLVAAHPLSTIFWGLRTKESIPQCICATHQIIRDKYAEQVLNIISAEQNVTNNSEMHSTLIEDLLQEGCAYVLTARFQTDPLERQFLKYCQMSGGRFLVGLTNNVRNISSEISSQRVDFLLARKYSS